MDLIRKQPLVHRCVPRNNKSICNNCPVYHVFTHFEINGWQVHCISCKIILLTFDHTAQVTKATVVGFVQHKPCFVSICTINTYDICTLLLVPNEECGRDSYESTRGDMTLTTVTLSTQQSQGRAEVNYLHVYSSRFSVQFLQ